MDREKLRNKLVVFLRQCVWDSQYPRTEDVRNEIEDALRAFGGSIFDYMPPYEARDFSIRPFLHLVKFPISFLSRVNTPALQAAKYDILHGNFEVTSTEWYKRNPNIISYINKILEKRQKTSSGEPDWTPEDEKIRQFLFSGIAYYVSTEKLQDLLSMSIKRFPEAHGEPIDRTTVFYGLQKIRLPFAYVPLFTSTSLTTILEALEYHGSEEERAKNPGLINRIKKELEKRGPTVATKQATYIPGTLTDFKDERTNDAASILFHHYNVEQGFPIDKAIRLVWQQLRFSGLDLTRPTPEEVEERVKKTKIEMEKLQREFDRKKRTR